MFEILLRTDKEILDGQAVRCEYSASGKLIVRATKGELLGMTDPLPLETVRFHHISFRRPLYGVVTDVCHQGYRLHMVAPGRINSGFTAVTSAEIIPFSASENEEAA